MIVIEALDHINLPAKDIEKTVEFYTVFLDFEIVENTDEEAIITFDDQLKIKLVQSEIAYSDQPILSFLLDVDDFTEALQAVEAHDIKIVSGPAETTNGENVVISDPSGNSIELYYIE